MVVYWDNGKMEATVPLKGLIGVMQDCFQSKGVQGDRPSRSQFVA